MSPVRKLPALLLLLLVAFAVPRIAQAQTENRTGQEFSPKYDAAHEMTVTGVIQEVTAEREAGPSAGMRATIAGSQGPVEAHFGPYVDKASQDLLRAGTTVQVTGAMSSFRGKQVLLARQLVFSGRTLTLRSPQGFLLRPKATHEAPSKSARADATKGGSL
jgi:hypothetical protein